MGTNKISGCRKTSKHPIDLKDFKKNETDSETNKPIEFEEYTDQDRARIEAIKTKLNGPQPPSIERDNINITELDTIGFIEAFGTINQPVIEMLVQHLENSSLGKGDSKNCYLNAALAILHSIKPRDELESMLLTQMIGSHNLAMEFVRRTLVSDQTIDGVTRNTERATKMMRTYTAQLEALNRYRGKSYQQKVTVEHVTVNAGGQAIVGHVNSSNPNGKGEEGGAP